MQTLRKKEIPLWRALKLVGPYPYLGFLGGLLIAVTTPKWILDSGFHPWRITLPGVPYDGSRPFTPLAFVVGIIALGVAWAGLLVRMERSRAPERDRTRAVLITAAIWFVPVMLGPPLLSSDVYSYAAQGEMVTRGIDPTSEPMTSLQYGNFLAHVDQTWKGSEGNPYGPVGMGLAAAAVISSGHDPDRAVRALQWLAVAGVALAAWGIHDLARRHGVSPPAALAFAVANPIVVIHCVGGAHNDAVMMGLLCAGCAVAHRHWRWGVVLITAAALVKLPGAAGLVYLAWTRRGAMASVKQRLRVVAEGVGIAAAVTVVACLVTGIGLGWIGAMRNAGQTKGTLSVATQLGFVVSHGLDSVGFDAAEDTWIDIFRFLGLAVAAAGCVLLLKNADRIGAVRATGLALLLVVVFGPVVWPWYFAPAFALLGASGMGRWRPSFVVLCGVFASEVFPTGENAKPVLERQHLLSLLLIVLIGAITIAAPWIVERFNQWRPQTLPHDRPGEDEITEADGLGWVGTPSR